MKNRPREIQPAIVPHAAKQAGAICARWAWVEPAVWTERMLTALEQGVKGGVWFSLMDKVYSPGNLRAAFTQVKANRGAAGCDHQTVAMFEARLEANLGELSARLRTDSYRPQKVRRVHIPKAGSVELRPLGIPTVRDRIVLCRSAEEAEAALERVRTWIGVAGLTLHPHKTRIVDATQEGFDFLGYHFERGRRWPRKKSIQKFRDAIRARTPRVNGQSLGHVIAAVNRTTQGWFEYFKHTTVPSVFRGLDGWIRRRLRRILWKRLKKSRSGLGTAHQRWPNTYFAKLGLFSMDAAHALARHSVVR